MHSFPKQTHLNLPHVDFGLDGAEQGEFSSREQLLYKPFVDESLISVVVISPPKAVWNVFDPVGSSQLHLSSVSCSQSLNTWLSVFLHIAHFVTPSELIRRDVFDFILLNELVQS